MGIAARDLEEHRIPKVHPEAAARLPRGIWVLAVMIGLMLGLAEQAIKNAGEERGAIFTDDGRLVPARRAFAEDYPHDVPASALFYELIDACPLRMQP